MLVRILRLAAIAVAALAVAVGGASAAAAASGHKARTHHPQPSRTVTVMTRNLYLGTDLLPLAAAKPGGPFEHAVAGALADLRATGPVARMKLIAGEIAAAKPDLVGLQEASIWRTASRSGGGGHVVVDYVKLIMAQLRRLHAPYRVVTRHLSLDLHGPSSARTSVDFKDGNVVLARTGVTVSHVRSHDFGHLLKITTAALGTVTVRRSYNELDAAVNGARFHFVNAHLEAYSASVRLQQAQELVAGPLRSPERTILVGDLNSGPHLASAADRPPFEAISRDGFVDERTSTPNCCLQGSLRTGRWDHIVDHIMVKPRVKLVRSFVTGRETTRAGRHPSDHGGVVSVLRFPAGS